MRGPDGHDFRQVLSSIGGRISRALPLSWKVWFTLCPSSKSCPFPGSVLHVLSPPVRWFLCEYDAQVGGNRPRVKPCSWIRRPRVRVVAGGLSGCSGPSLARRLVRSGRHAFSFCSQIIEMRENNSLPLQRCVCLNLHRAEAEVVISVVVPHCRLFSDVYVNITVPSSTYAPIKNNKTSHFIL